MSLTERYLGVVLRSIPEPKRTDVELELRSSIEDAIEERAGAGEDRAAAERTVLEGLGDPSLLAGAYTGRPVYLIGPELFPLYRRFLPRLIAVVVPLAMLVMAAVRLVGGGDIQGAISAGISGGISVAMQIAFWATATFVFLEWAAPARQARSELVSAAGRWSVERLPKVADARISVGEAAREIVTVLVGIGILVFAGGLSTTDVYGADLPVLHHDFRTIWVPILVTVLALRGACHLLAYNAGRWTPLLASANALLHVAFAAPLVVLALAGWIVDERFARTIGWWDLASGGSAPMLAVAVGITLATGWAVVRILLRARRAQGIAPLVGASSRSA
jgi:hypothetical protein